MLSAPLANSISRGDVLNPADAVHHHTEALTNATETGRRLEQARAMDGLANALGDTDTARRHRGAGVVA
jgi:hypothetical protein